MAYTKFEKDVPLITDGGSAQITDIRNDLMALRDAVVAGVMPDWNMSETIGGGSEDEPDELIWKNGVEWFRAQITWGTTGGEDGNPTSVIHAYSANSGGLYDTIATWGGTYSATGILTATTWS